MCINISPPSISSAIAQLETEFGTQLFIRHHAQGLSLTPAGERFLLAAKRLLRQSDELASIANEISSEVAGPLIVGAFRTFSALILPDLCLSFLEKYPKVKMTVAESDGMTLFNQLRGGDISLALTYKENVPEDLSFEPLADVPTYILLPAKHRLARRVSLRLSELEDMPFILLDMPLTRDYFLAMFEKLKLTPRIAAASEFSETVRCYVACGLGFSLATARPKSKIAANGRSLAYVKLDGEFPQMQLGIASCAGMRSTRVTEAFKEHCRELITHGDIPGMSSLS